MSRERPGDPAESAPVAIAAISLDGRCRERSPADMALFGPAGDRFPTRFADPGMGETLLARAASDGAAEATARLVTATGTGQFRISLWRQRGGERIRILAALAARLPAPEAAPAPSGPGDLPLLSAGIGGAAQRVLNMAEELRDQDGQGARGEDLMTLGWRLLGLAEDLARSGESAGRELRPRPAELDLGQLLRRLIRIAGRGPGRPGIEADGLPERGAGPMVMADGGQLWTALDMLLEEAAEAAGPGGVVALALRAQEGGGMAIEILPKPSDTPLATVLRHVPPRQISSVAETLAARNGFSVESRGGGEAVVAIPRLRRIDPA